MNTENPLTFVYLLVDNGLLAEVSAGYTEPDPRSRPTWLASIYSERALAVSPILIDLEAAYEAGALDQVMGYVNALRPALHVSIIETDLDLEQTAQHLRRFIFILDPESKQFTFRYADCTILALLPSVLTPDQWGYMAGTMTGWQIHDRSGAIVRLPSTNFIETVSIPFRLESDQLTALDEASEPDHYIAKVKTLHATEVLPGNSLDHHNWSKAARQIWVRSGNSNSLILLFLTEAAIMTRGTILLSTELESIILTNSASEFREILQQTGQAYNRQAGHLV